MPATFATGSLVTARGREWVVLPDSAPDMLVLRPLGGGAEDTAAVFPAFESVAPARFEPPTPADLGDSQAAGLLRTALRIGLRSGAGPFRSLAGIAVEPRAYQLVPLLMALRQNTVRLLISDDVGIGKTIEAGLIASELLAQGDAQRLAVLCSPALAEQWQQELRTKFGIDAELVLSSTVSRLERDLNLGQSLFDKHPHVVVSTDFIKSPRHQEDFVRHCPELVIVDEAHTCVAADDAATGRQNQLRYELLKKIAADSQRHLLLVTATPHSGKEAGFRNLLGLLSSELANVDINGRAGREQLARHFVQRRRADIRKYLDQDTQFPADREYLAESKSSYRLSPAYRALLDDAIGYASGRVTEAGRQGRKEARIAWWSAIALLRSIVSSPRAAAQTLMTRSPAAIATSAQEADELGAPIMRDAADVDSLEGLDTVPGAETDASQEPLAAMAARAAALEGPEQDLKLAALIKHVKALLKDGYNPIVFCRYIPTAEYVADHLGGALGRKTLVRAVTGTISPQQRQARIEELAEQAEAMDAARVLVATDCLSEGVNLQHHFDSVVHYDLAWNPTRHDQREGRVDRYGQKRDTVRVITLYGSDNGIDGKVLDVLIRKHRQIRKDLGISVSVPDESVGAVTDAILEWVLMRGQSGPEQEGLFEVEELAEVQRRADALATEWNSSAEKERESRSKFAQNTIRPEVAREVATVRDALGTASEVGAFTQHALTALGAVISQGADGDPRADLSGTPVGLRDALAPIVGVPVVDGDRALALRTTAAVARGEAALVRTDPAIAAIAAYVLDTALDPRAFGPRPARRCGVVRTKAVETRTTLLLVRYRFHLMLPSRAGERELVAEDARVLAFEGTPGAAQWLTTERARALLDAQADENTAPAFGERTIARILGELGELDSQLNDYGDELAAELMESHRRVRSASGEIVRGLRVTAQKPADVLGVYAYLPVAESAAATAPATFGEATV